MTSMSTRSRLTRIAAGGAVLAVALAGAAALAVPATAGPKSRPARRGPAATGNFVSGCRYSHSAPDDPIVHPASPGASHSHDFFGNTSTDAFSSLESLQAAPDLCRRDGDKAAYWVPTLSDGGKVVKPVDVQAYYLVAGRDPASIQPFPLGLRVVTDPAASPERWGCIGAAGQTPESMTPPDCPGGMHLVLRVHFPDCWDGQRLDSTDHRSHMAYAADGACPADHPVAVPHLRLGVHYPAGVGGADVTLSSGAPDTAHADFFNAWDPSAQARLVEQCLQAAVKCGGKGPA
ncbi:MAG: hypothetical protein QOI99_310 [Actinomycetota bacterium]|nr:hypothetical protein [Actinomycetota bacterium]